MEKLRRRPFYEFQLYQWFVETIAFGIFLLIIPMVLVSVLFNGLLFTAVYSYYAIGQIVFIYYIIRITASIKPSLILNPEKLKQQRDYNRINQLFAILITGMVFLNYLYPIRGWDALQFYFPNALFFYLENDIPATLNPFTLYPTHKPPLNTLLITFVYYVTGQPNAPFIPIMFLLGTSFLIVLFGQDMGLTKKYSLTASCIFLTLPAVYFVTIEYAYYQDLPLCFFISLSVIYFNKATKSGSIVDYLISAMGVSLSVFSKLSGFTIPLILVACFRFGSNKLIKFLKIALVVILTSYLSYKVSTEIYIGFFPLIIFSGVLLVLGFWRSYEPAVDNIGKLSLIIISYVTSLFVWLIHMFRFDSVINTLYSLYFKSSDSQIQWNFSFAKTSTEVYLENAHSVSLFTTAFPFLLGSQFTLFLLVPKLIGLKKSFSDYWILFGWFISFYMLWLTYHAQVSIRYLSVIWVPFCLIVVIGIKEIIEYFELEKIENLILLIGIGLNLIFYYPFIPLEFVLEDFHLRMINFHQSIVRLMLYVGIFSGLMYLIFKRLQIKLKKSDFTLGKRIKYVELSLVIIIGLAPVSLQLSQYATYGFDSEEFQENWVYDNRPAVKELVNEIISLNFDFEEITISTNIPGLGYKIQRPVLDLISVSSYSNQTLTDILTNPNVTDTFRRFVDYEIHYVITILEDNNFYPTFVKFVERYPFLGALNNSTSTLLYSNLEFALFSINN